MPFAVGAMERMRDREEEGWEMSENKEMLLKRREIWSRKGRKDEEERSAEEGRYDINTQMKGEVM